jgi:hypothetical protein
VVASDGRARRAIESHVERCGHRDLGAAGVNAERPAFYALPSGGWRDYWTLLHPPYTLWHLSYVAIGAALAPRLNIGYLLYSLAAFFLAVGLAAHALDELHGRPLGTRIPSWLLVAIAVVGLSGAAALGILGVVLVSPWMLAFIVVGAFLAVAYNLEAVGGFFHADVWFAVAWGGFPALTGAFAQTGTITLAAVIVAAACTLLSAVQRTLSTPVRRLRRRAAHVAGTVTWGDGSVDTLDAGALRATPERTLQLLSGAVPLFALALIVAALGRR